MGTVFKRLTEGEEAMVHQVKEPLNTIALFVAVLSEPCSFFLSPPVVNESS